MMTGVWILIIGCGLLVVAGLGLVDDRRRRLILRGLLAVVAVVALVIAALWTYLLLDALAADYDPDPALAPYERRALIILGALGIGALIVTGSAGLAYARTAAQTWITSAVAGIVCAIPVLVVWIDLWEVFSGTD